MPFLRLIDFVETNLHRDHLGDMLANLLRVQLTLLLRYLLDDLYRRYANIGQVELAKRRQKLLRTYSLGLLSALPGSFLKGAGSRSTHLPGNLFTLEK